MTNYPSKTGGGFPELAEEVWVVHAFQKKSTIGIKTLRHEVDLIKDRLKRLKEMLK